MEINYKIVYKKPWIWWLLKLVFKEINWNFTVVTIGNTIYSSRPIHPRVLAHELVHVRQQKASKLYAYCYFIPRYIFDKNFRIKVEAEGYAEENKFKL
jgi:hypothetical protein